MDIFSEFPSGRFFKAAEITGPTTLTISRVEKVAMADGAIKPVAHFDEDPRGWVLNVTARAELAERFGRDTAGWVGKSITLVTRKVQGPNGPTTGIRLADTPLSEVMNDHAPGFDEPRDDVVPSAKPAASATVRRFM